MIGAVAIASVLAATQPVQPPRAVRAVGVDDKSGQHIPLDLVFTEASGRRVPLSSYFDGERPVFLVLAYARCQALCSVVLRGAARAVARLELEPGRDYRVVTVSIDPAEETAAAAARRLELLEQAGRPGQTDRWTYLVGGERPIRALADSLGFRYTWDPRTEQWAHPAVAFVLAPDGKIVRTIAGIDFPPSVLGPTLAAARSGERQAAIAEGVLRCFRFDPNRGRLRERIEAYFRVGASAILAGLLSLVVVLFVWERRRTRP